MDLIEISVLAEDPAFIARVRAGVVSHAQVVKAEAASVEGHAIRLRYARNVLRTSSVVAREMAYAVATTNGFTENTDDAGLMAIIADLWNEYAGV